METARRGGVVGDLPEPSPAPPPRLAAVAPGDRPALRPRPPHRHQLAARRRDWQEENKVRKRCQEPLIGLRPANGGLAGGKLPAGTYRLTITSNAGASVHDLA